MGRRRPRGTGSLSTRTDRAGVSTWYGKWSVNGRQVKRRIGLVRPRGSSQGLTRLMAERRLQEFIAEGRVNVPATERMTFAQLADDYMAHLEVVGRKTSTLGNYRSILSRHLLPAFADRPVDRIEPAEIERLIAAKWRDGLSAKSTRHIAVFLNGVMAFAVKRGLVVKNPCEGVDLPRVPRSTTIRYLSHEELHALYRACPPDRLGQTDRVLYMLGAMTGARLGELLAVQWRSIDFAGGTIRVERSIVLGQIGTPKSGRGRVVPMPDPLAVELARHQQRSAYQDDDELVVGHPDSGSTLDPSALRRRFKRTLKRAEIREARLHDLRHSYAVALAKAGTPLRVIQELLGHRSIYSAFVTDEAVGKGWAARAFGGEGTYGGTDATERNATERGSV